eukprot:5720614-Alexandrium_andersonii.AAC.1
MSASLVGSEMCIRDSCSCRPGRGARCVIHGDACAFAGRDGDPKRAQNCGCLLYTSDAADDM